MAMSTVVLGSAHHPDGSTTTTYECFADAATGTIQLPTNIDLRKVSVRTFDTRGTSPAVLTQTLNVSTGVVTLGNMSAGVALTGVADIGGAGTQTFTGTGGVVGTVASGTNLAANSMIVGVSGTTITVDKPIQGALTAVSMFTHAITKVEYCP